MQRIREWLINKLVGDQPVIMNVDFADIVFRPGNHVVKKTILMKNVK